MCMRAFVKEQSPKIQLGFVKLVCLFLIFHHALFMVASTWLYCLSIKKENESINYSWFSTELETICVISGRQEWELKRGGVFEEYAYTWFTGLCVTLLPGEDTVQLQIHQSSSYEHKMYTHEDRYFMSAISYYCFHGQQNPSIRDYLRIKEKRVQFHISEMHRTKKE